MLGWGNESLYFTVAPSLYLTTTALRKILYDHIYLRPLPDLDYSEVPEADLTTIRNNYLARRDKVFGIGHVQNGVWLAEE
jgi:tuberculosinol/isotuberculosinol synthase